MPSSPDTKFAVLIDADNVQPGVADALLSEIAKYGVASVKRAYGDWTSDRLKGWKKALNAQAIRPVQQFAYTTGKNATDGAMIIDAMDLLYTGRFDGFCLVTSDSDFTGLATRLREAGVTVYGFGEKSTPESLVKACDRFIYLHILRAPNEPEPDQAAQTPQTRMSQNELRGDGRLVSLLRSGIDAGSDDDGWAHLSEVRNNIVKQAVDFDPRNWGYAKWGDLVEAIGLFDVRRDGATFLISDPKSKATKKQPPKKQAAKKVAKKTAAKKVQPGGG